MYLKFTRYDGFPAVLFRCLSLPEKVGIGCRIDADLFPATLQAFPGQAKGCIF